MRFPSLQKRSLEFHKFTSMLLPMRSLAIASGYNPSWPRRVLSIRNVYNEWGDQSCRSVCCEEIRLSRQEEVWKQSSGRQCEGPHGWVRHVPTTPTFPPAPQPPSTFLSSSTWRVSPAPVRACPSSLCKASIFSPSSSSISSFSIRSCRSLSPARWDKREREQSGDTCWGGASRMMKTTSLEVNTLGTHPQEGGRWTRRRAVWETGEERAQRWQRRAGIEEQWTSFLGGLSLLLLGSSQLLLVLLKHVLPMPCLLWGLLQLLLQPPHQGWHLLLLSF